MQTKMLCIIFFLAAILNLTPKLAIGSEPHLTIETSTNLLGMTNCYVIARTDEIYIDSFVVNHGKSKTQELLLNKNYKFKPFKLNFGQKKLLFTLTPNYDLIELQVQTNFGDIDFSNKNLLDKIMVKCIKNRGNHYKSPINTYNLLCGKDKITINDLIINRGYFKNYRQQIKLPVTLHLGDVITLFTISDIVVPFLEVDIITDDGSYRYTFDAE